MNAKDSKAVLELKKGLMNAQANIGHLYRITSALYQEINDIKRFVNYKNENSLGDVESNASNLSGNPIGQNNPNNFNRQQGNLNDHFSVLNNVEEFADNLPRNNANQGGRKLKIINN